MTPRAIDSGGVGKPTRPGFASPLDDAAACAGFERCASLGWRRCSDNLEPTKRRVSARTGRNRRRAANLSHSGAGDLRPELTLYACQRIIAGSGFFTVRPAYPITASSLSREEIS